MENPVSHEPSHLKHDPAWARDPVRCRVLLVEFLSRQMPGLWIPLAEVRAETRWPSDQTGVKRLSSIVARAASDGLIEFKSGEFSGRASVRLKVTTPRAPAPEAGNSGKEVSP